MNTNTHRPAVPKQAQPTVLAEGQVVGVEAGADLGDLLATDEQGPAHHPGAVHGEQAGEQTVPGAQQRQRQGQQGGRCRPCRGEPPFGRA